MTWNRKDLIAIKDLSSEEIEKIFKVTAALKRTMGRSVKKLPALRGKTIVNLFLEPSTRTRIAFEVAATRLSADVISLDMAASSTTKGETLSQTSLFMLDDFLSQKERNESPPGIPQRRNSDEICH